MSGFFQYMGSKKKLLNYILPNIPEHKIYVEPYHNYSKNTIEVIATNYGIITREELYDREAC